MGQNMSDFVASLTFVIWFWVRQAVFMISGSPIQLGLGLGGSPK